MRHEFSRKVRRQAEERAGGHCEATGARYGYEPKERCNADLSVTGIEHDHYPLPAHAEGSNTLENDVVCCPRCNRYANNHEDTPREAKMKRVQKKAGRRAMDVERTPKAPPKMRGSRGFAPGHRPIKTRNTLRRER